MTHQLLTLPKAVLLSAGTIKPGWKISFFLTGLSTPVDVWTTSARNVAHTQPVEADAAGVLPPVYLDPTIVYKATVTDAADVLQYTVDPVNDQLLSQGVIGEYLYPTTAAETSASVTPTNKAYPPGDIRRYGTNTTPGTTDMSVPLASALLLSATHPTILQDETYLYTAALTVPAFGRVTGAGRNTVLQKGFSGTGLTVKKYAVVEHLRMNNVRGTFTGRGILVDEGVNTPTLANQGHQLFDNVIIDETDGYPLEYSGTNSVGWVSVARNCKFNNYNSDAAVKWPDETTTGGNRQLIGCYTSDALVNVGGCDNGMIHNNFCGASAGSNSGIIFPASTANRAKKLIITCNRISMVGTMTVRGIDHNFANNIIGGSVVFASNAAADGAENCLWDSNNTLTGTFTDSSAFANRIYIDTPVAYTPTWTASGTPPAIGDADVRCSYTRRNGWIRDKGWIKFGSTTTFGTGTYTFTNSHARLDSGTTDYVGAAFLKDRAGTVRAIFNVSVDGVNMYHSTGAVTAVAPVTWASGDVLAWDLEYKIHS